VVVAREGERGEKRLVGYVVMEEGGDERELRRRLKERLPEYMVPGVIVKVEEMPLTSNGKLDRKRLPEVEYRSRRGEEGREGRTEVEKELVRIWRELLRVEEIGIEDNFFEMGG